MKVKGRMNRMNKRTVFIVMVMMVFVNLFPAYTGFADEPYTTADTVDFKDAAPEKTGLISVDDAQHLMQSRVQGP